MQFRWDWWEITKRDVLKRDEARELSKNPYDLETQKWDKRKFHFTRLTVRTTLPMTVRASGSPNANVSAK
jgi:hypothetical protein